jgi:COP9 signalosome complex subunit 6
MATSTAAAAAPANALITTQSGSELQIILHPLVLLTISDYITRHTLRGQTSPIVGGLLGLQNARDITIEHAFDVDMIPNEDDPETYKLNGVHFNQRLDMSER